MLKVRSTDMPNVYYNFFEGRVKVSQESLFMRATLNSNYVKEMNSGPFNIQTIAESMWGYP